MFGDSYFKFGWKLKTTIKGYKRINNETYDNHYNVKAK